MIAGSNTGNQSKGEVMNKEEIKAFKRQEARIRELEENYKQLCYDFEAVNSANVSFQDGYNVITKLNRELRERLTKLEHK